MGYLIVTRRGVVFLSLATHIIEELQHSVKRNGTGKETFMGIMARLSIAMYAGLTGMDNFGSSVENVWHNWNRIESHYLQMYGMLLRFIEPVSTVPDPETFTFMHNAQIANKLETLAMEHM